MGPAFEEKEQGAARKGERRGLLSTGWAGQAGCGADPDQVFSGERSRSRSPLRLQAACAVLVGEPPYLHDSALGALTSQRGLVPAGSAEGHSNPVSPHSLGIFWTHATYHDQPGLEVMVNSGNNPAQETDTGWCLPGPHEGSSVGLPRAEQGAGQEPSAQ